MIHVKVVLALAVGAVLIGNALATGYDPLAVDPAFKARTLELVVVDPKRDREIPLLVYLPATTAPAPVVLFSHGVGGSRHGDAFLGEHWAARGYVAVFLQHPGSDTSVWRDLPVAERLEAMRRAASLQNFMRRTQDVHAVLDALASWNTRSQHPLAGRLDPQAIGMSGHSFGAVTTQAVSGENFAVLGTSLTDPRIKAAIAFSPSSPRNGTAEQAFGAVKIPWLLMTGTKDIGPIGQADLASRLAVYPALRGAPKYEVVLNKAEHSAFADRALPGDREPRNPNHHRVMLALTTAFWDAYLRLDNDALAWLNGAGPRSVLEPDDRWQSSAH
ncbi:MAG: dienelactone hydrolase [Verrucomicrobia bacterium]|nr:dienelactone hydrolase [Verrucomicrobiota bacterium]